MLPVTLLLLPLAASAAKIFRPSIETNDVMETWPKSSADLIVDILLTTLREYLEVEKDTVVPIPDFENGFKENWLGLEVDGDFKAKGGAFRNPATIRRSGPSEFKRIENGFTFSTTVSFSEMNISFDSYTVDLIGISESGKIDVRIGNNAINLDIGVVTRPVCRVTVDRADMTAMSGVDVHMTGLGVLDWLAEDITSWVLSSYKTSFSKIIEDALKKKLSEVLVKTKICKMIHFPPDSYLLM